MAKTYDAEEIEDALLASREGDNCFLLDYPPKRRMNDVSRLIWDFKENQPQAIRVVLEILIPQLCKWRRHLRDSAHCGYIVTIPGHERGKPNIACEVVAATLQKRFDWLQHLPDSLRRIKTVAKASYAASYLERPKYVDHVRSIKYFGPRMLKRSAILMLDDVFTTSETSTACRDILVKGSGCGKVVGLFIGRTLND
jgi:predicted amidophosphoribosyltransferase